MREKFELEEVKLRVPKPIMDFLRKNEKYLEEGNVQAYLERNIIGCVKADIDAATVFVPDPEEVITENNLGYIFKAMPEPIH